MDEKFSDILERMKSEDPNWTDFEGIASEFGVYEWPTSDDWETRITEKRFDEWVCWDTPVGKAVIYLDDEPVAVSLKAARKAETEYTWVSLAAFDKTKAFVRDAAGDRTPTPTKFVGPDTVISLEADEIGNSRAANYARHV